MKENKTLIVLILSIIFLIVFKYHKQWSSDPIVGKIADKGTIDMPIVENSTPQLSFFQSAPKEQRESEYWKFLSASPKVQVQKGSGSGTICYYNSKNNTAYVISCGHLWAGNKTAVELQKNPQKAQLIFWYQNNKKLSSPKKYDADVLFWSNDRGFDVSLLSFKPDWVPRYFPIAKEDYIINKGNLYNSVGCDGGREVARYEMEFVEYRGVDAIFRRNSPRPGRSGGGMITNDNIYIGVCWGTSDTKSGSGIGYFTPLSAIYSKFKENKFNYLLEINNHLARDIKILDRATPNKTYPPEFIPIPQEVHTPLPQWKSDFFR